LRQEHDDSAEPLSSEYAISGTQSVNSDTATMSQFAIVRIVTLGLASLF